MTCTKCSQIIHRVRIIDGEEYCISCAPFIPPLVLSHVKSHYGSFKGTVAHLNDIRARKYDYDSGKTFRENPKKEYVWLSN